MANIVRCVTFPVGARAVERDIFVNVFDIVSMKTLPMFDSVSINTLTEFINVFDSVSGSITVTDNVLVGVV